MVRSTGQVRRAVCFIRMNYRFCNSLQVFTYWPSCLSALPHRLWPHPGQLQVQVWHQKRACTFHPHTWLHPRHTAGQDGIHREVWQVCSPVVYPFIFALCFFFSHLFVGKSGWRVLNNFETKEYKCQMRVDGLRKEKAQAECMDIEDHNQTLCKFARAVSSSTSSRQ